MQTRASSKAIASKPTSSIRATSAYLSKQECNPAATRNMAGWSPSVSIQKKQKTDPNFKLQTSLPTQTCWIRRTKGQTCDHRESWPQQNSTLGRECSFQIFQDCPQEIFLLVTYDMLNVPLIRRTFHISSAEHLLDHFVSIIFNHKAR